MSFANFYLGWLDRYIKEMLRVRGYVHYMDDLVLWHSSRQSLEAIQERCQEFVANHLGLEFKPSAVQRTGGPMKIQARRVSEGSESSLAYASGLF